MRADGVYHISIVQIDHSGSISNLRVHRWEEIQWYSLVLEAHFIDRCSWQQKRTYTRGSFLITETHAQCEGLGLIRPIIKAWKSWKKFKCKSWILASYFYLWLPFPNFQQVVLHLKYFNGFQRVNFVRRTNVSMFLNQTMDRRSYFQMLLVPKSSHCHIPYEYLNLCRPEYLSCDDLQGASVRHDISPLKITARNSSLCWFKKISRPNSHLFSKPVCRARVNS